MNTRLLMISSALFLGFLGLLSQFLPQEILESLGVTPNAVTVMLVQLIGSAYLGFAMMNWMARENIIGGIYNRPMAMANFIHFTIGTISLLRVLTKGNTSSQILILFFLYLLFAGIFTYVLFTHPKKAEN